MHQLSREMKNCIDECLRCYQICLGTAMTHCLEQGGKHVEPKHFRLMMACAEICRTSAHFMLLNTPHRRHAGVRRGVPPLRRELPQDGSVAFGGRDSASPAGRG